MDLTTGLILKRIFQLIFVLIFLTSYSCHAISRQTEEAMRDFSKLRLEKRLAVPTPTSIPILIPFTGNQLQNEDVSGDESVAAATEDMGMQFKPSYTDSTNFNNHQYPPHSSGDNRGINNSPEDYPEPGLGGFFPPSPITQQNPNFHRPLLGGPGPGSDDDNSSVGMGIGPTGYGAKNHNQKPEASSNPSESYDGDDEQEPYLNSESPPDIENGGEGYGRGYGGLFDSDPESSAEDENDQNPEGSYYGGSSGGGGGQGGEGTHNSRHHPQEGPYDPAELAEALRNGYSNPSASGGPHGSNREDYADY